MLRLSFLALLLFVPCTLPAQEKKAPLPGDVMIEKYLAAETDKLSQKFLDGAKTLAEWKEKRLRLQREYLDMLGLWPLPEKTPLKATVTGQLEAHGVVVENLHFQSKPGLYVTANLFRPKKIDGKLPAILYVCGHSGRGRDGGRTAFQDHGFWFANNGYVCLIVDTLQLGEIPGIHHGTYGLREKNGATRMWWHSAGYTPAGVECWNGIRALDYLVTRPEVDPAKLGVTGISGGGATTFWIAAADERVQVAVPVSGMSDLESYVKNKVVNGHCDCMFLYNTYQWDWTTIAALVAPRPLLFANSDNDPIFPMDGNRRIIAKLRKVYGLYEKPTLVDDYVSPGGHALRPDLRVAVFKFLNKHLKGDTTTKVEDSAQYKEIPGPELRAFPTDLPADALNGKIDETFVPRAKVELPAEGKFAQWKKALLDDLQKRSLPLITSKIPAGVDTNKGNARGTWCITQPGIEVFMTSPMERNLKEEIYGIVVQDTDEYDSTISIIKSTAADWLKMAVLLYPRGLTERTWTVNSPPNYVERAHALLGQTVDEGRVYDAISAYRMMPAKRLEKGRWRMTGYRRGGIYAAYAALFEPSIMEVVVIDPPKSHLEGPHFLGVLRVLDIPDALGLLAPTPLTIVGGNDPAFDRTAEIYRRAGAADKLTWK